MLYQRIVRRARYYDTAGYYAVSAYAATQCPVLTYRMAGYQPTDRHYAQPACGVDVLVARPGKLLRHVPYAPRPRLIPCLYVTSRMLLSLCHVCSYTLRLLQSHLPPTRMRLQVKLVAFYYFLAVPLRAAFVPWATMLDAMALCTDLIFDVLAFVNVLILANSAYKNARSRWVVRRSKVTCPYALDPRP
eukprot:834610-Rhodomonas_salina.2